MAEIESYASHHTGEEIDKAITYIKSYQDKLNNLISYLYTGTFSEGQELSNKELLINDIIDYLTKIEENETKNRKEKIDEIINYLTEIKENETKNRKEKIDSIIDYLTKVETDETNKETKIDSIIDYLNQDKKNNIDNIINYLNQDKKNNIDTTISNFKGIENKTYTIKIPSNNWKLGNGVIKWCVLGSQGISITDDQNNTINNNNIITDNSINYYIYSSGKAIILYISPWYNNGVIIYGIPSSEETDTLITLKVTNLIV